MTTILINFPYLVDYAGPAGYLAKTTAYMASSGRNAQTSSVFPSVHVWFLISNLKLFEALCIATSAMCLSRSKVDGQTV